MRAQIIGNGLLTARVPAHFAAVLEALQVRGASADALRAIDESAWPDVLSLCDRAKLALPLAMRSYRGFPDWVTQRLRGNLADSFDRFRHTQQTYLEAASALAAADVPWIVMKGFAQAPNFVAAPQFRVQNDIDLYTPREYVASAVEALEGIGYQPNEREDYRRADHAPTMVRFREWKWTGNRYDPEMPMCIEIHYCLWNHGVSMIPLTEVEEFWNRRVQRSLGSMQFPALHPVDHLGYFALHILREVFAGERVVHLALELATFLNARSNDAGFWNEWKSLHSPQLRQAEAMAMALAADWFSATMPPAVREEVEALPAAHRAWMRSFGGSPLQPMFRRTRDGRLLQMLFAQTSESRWKILRRALAPGIVAGPGRVTGWAENPVAPRKQRWAGRLSYPAYLANRARRNGMAILCFLAHGLELCVARLTVRRICR